jgi:hypothetical protein
VRPVKDFLLVVERNELSVSTGWEGNVGHGLDSWLVG